MSPLSRTCAILEESMGVPFAPDDVLRLRVPNSLMLMQAVFALESQLDVSVDLSALDYSATVNDLVGTFEAPTRDVALIPAPTVALAPTRDSALAPAPTVALTPIQTAYLLGSEPDLELGGQATFMYAEASYDCTAEALAAAARLVISRHDVLTYGIDLDEGVMTSGGADASACVVEGAPTSGLEALREEMIAQAKSSNDDGPYVCVRVCDAGLGRAKVLAYFNMVVMDAGSLYVFFRELSSAVAGVPLPESMPYAEAARRAWATADAEQRARDKEYWCEKARSFPAAPEPSARVMGTDAWGTTRFSHVIEPDDARALEEAAHRAQASTSALILAACAAVVARWRNDPALLCNVTVSKRTALDQARPVLGDFTSSMLVGIDVSSSSTLSDLASAISADLFEGLAHGSVGGVEVMADLLRDGADQQAATAPFVFTSYLGGAAEGLGVALDRVYTQTAQVCLDMQAMPAPDGGIVLSWDVVPQYFPQAADMFARLVEEIACVSAGRDALPLHDTQTERLAKAYNRTDAAPSDLTLLDLVERAVSRSPEKTAIVGRDRSYTYRELWERAGRLACYLRAAGVRPGGHVIVKFTKQPDDIVAMVAALRAQAAYIPVAAALPRARREAICALVPDAVVVTTEIARVEGGRCDVEAGDRIDDAASRCAPDDVAYLIFTSGSTGTPKGVVISHRGAVGTILDVNRRYGVGADDCLIGLSSFGFDLSVYDVFGTFAAGATLALVEDERDADEIARVLADEHVTLWNSAPALMELLLLRCDGEGTFPLVRTIMLSGDRIPASLPRRAQAIFPSARLYSLGGATEASIWSIQYPLAQDSLEERIPYGYPLMNQGIHVLGYDGVACPRGVPGDIWISGAGVAVGYLGAPEATARAFRDLEGRGRCYRTGDVGVFNHEGFVEFLGREDRQVKVDGYRIELGEIEAALARSGLVETSCALTVDCAGKQALLCAYVPRASADRDAVRRALAERLPSYMVPRRLVAVETLPVTANGKLDQKALAALAATSCTPAASPQPARPMCATADVEAVRTLFEKVLKRPVTDTSASFFSLGGDSLGFQTLLRDIARQRGCRLRFRDVIRNPSVEATAALVAAACERTASEGAPVAPERPSCVQEAGTEGQRAFGDSPVTDSEADGPFPLTEMQMAYYVGRHEGFELSGVGEHFYIESIARVDIERLERALSCVVRRHDMLRAVFTDDARQRVLPEVPDYRIAVRDLTQASADEIDAAILAVRDELSHQCFDLGTWPLFSLSAFALPDGSYRLFFSVDMIIGDGASQRIFMNDLTRAYEQGSLPPSPGSYRSYVIAARRAQVERDALPPSTEIERLMGAFPLGNVLPTCGDLGSVTRMRRLSWLADAVTADALERRAQEVGVSLSTVLLFAYAAGLALFSRDGKAGVNVTTYNRDEDVAGASELFGDFTGVVLVDFDDADEALTPQLLQERLLEQMGEGRSGVKLLAEIARRRAFAGHVLAPFVFTSLLFGKARTVPTVLGEVQFALSQTPQVLIDHQVMRVGDSLSIAWDFAEQVLDPALVTALFSQFRAMLTSFAEGGALTAPVPASTMRLVRDAWAAASPLAEADPRASLPAEGAALSSAEDALAAWVSAQLASEFSLAGEIALDDSLFDKGLDSLGFVRLVQMVQKKTHRQIPLAQALAAPSVRTLVHLAQAAHVADEGSSLVLLREGSPERVVVMVHGGFGTVDVYRDLAVGMPEGVQVWGVQFEGFAKAWPQHLSIDEIVSRYVADLEHVLAPEARIAVVGWSLGGTLGHALATRLGERCCGLALLDSLAPGYFEEVGSLDLEGDRAVLASVGIDAPDARTLPELWGGLTHDAEVVCRIARAFSQSLFEDVGVAAGHVRIVDLSSLRTLVAARNAYRPALRSFTAPTLIVVPDDGEASNERDWDGYVGETERVFVCGNHYSFVTGPDATPTVEAVARFAAAALAR